MSARPKWRTYFRAEWENQYDWNARVENDNTRFRCKACERVYMLSNMSIQASKNHIENKRHSKLINSKGFKLQSKCSSITNKRKICDSDSPSVHQPKIKQAKLEPYLPPQNEFNKADFVNDFQNVIDHARAPLPIDKDAGTLNLPKKAKPYKNIHSTGSKLNI